MIPEFPQRSFRESPSLQKKFKAANIRGNSKERKQAFGDQRLSPWKTSPSFSFGSPRTLHEERSILTSVSYDRIASPSCSYEPIIPREPIGIPKNFGSATRFIDDKKWHSATNTPLPRYLPIDSPLNSPKYLNPKDIHNDVHTQFYKHRKYSPGMHHSIINSLSPRGHTPISEQFDGIQKIYQKIKFPCQTGPKMSANALPATQNRLNSPLGIKKTSPLVQFTQSPANVRLQSGRTKRDRGECRTFDLAKQIGKVDLYEED